MKVWLARVRTHVSGRGVAATIAVTLLLWVPFWSGWFLRARASSGIALDVALLLSVIWLVPGSRSRWFGSWRAMIGGGLWTLFTVFEAARVATKYATNDDLPMYDALLLARHLYILGRDLYGSSATVLLVVVLVAPVVSWFIVSFVLARIEDVARVQPAARRMTTLAGCGVIVLLAAQTFAPATRWVTPRLVRNTQASIHLLRFVSTEIKNRRHAELEKVTLTRKPDVVYYIVESYGGVALHERTLKARWRHNAKKFEGRLAEAGWSTVTGLIHAPVHGGRSWIADTSLLLGVDIAHESTYQHFISLAHELPSLPKYFEQQGYETVLIKPKDRARPGVRLENPFGFTKTVFAADLQYTGPYVGWGEIPDQYTIERVEDEVIRPIKAPVFAFFHLVSSHLPWVAAPPLLDHWEDWHDRKGARKPMYDDRSIASELRMQMTRWRRERKFGDRAPESEQPARYLDNVLYDLEVVVRLAESGLHRERLIIVMGDHQPPLLSPGSGPEVPVHVMSTDPTLLEAFRKAGFTDGMVPMTTRIHLKHEDLFALTVASVAE